MKRQPIKVAKAYRDFMKHRGRYAVLYGGAGSGKSYAGTQKDLLRCMQQPDERILVLRKVARTIKGSTFQLARDVLSDWGIKAKINRTDHSIELPTGSQLLHAGLDDPEKIKSIHGITSITIEEATEFTEDDFRQVDLRLRGDVPTYRQVQLRFNPIRSSHWLRRWIDEKPSGLAVWRTTFRDNPFIDAEYARVLGGLPEHLRSVYYEGLWGEDLRGRIFTEYDTVSEAPEGEPSAFGLDFGFNHPTALVAAWIGEEAYTLSEILYERGLTTSDLVDRMLQLDLPLHVPIYCDHSRPDTIEAMVRAGFNAQPANKQVLDGIETMRSRRMLVTASSSNLIAELLEYSWDETRDGVLLERPVKRKDDAVDSARYAVHSYVAEGETGLALW